MIIRGFVAGEAVHGAVVGDDKMLPVDGVMAV
jgi:hypothetical protein